MEDTVFLNGEFMPRSGALISPDDRGFLFGDGLYEVTPAYGGRFLAMDRHLARLRRGSETLSIPFPEGIEALHSELLRRNQLEKVEMAIVYLQVTRGTAPRSHAFPDPPVPATVYAWAKAFERPPMEEWEKGYSAATAPDRRWTRADLKTVQLLPQVLGQQAAREAGAHDALLVKDGMALEGAHNNVFFVFGEVLTTHPASNQILPGITREIVLELAREEGIPVEERAVPLEEARRASEVFYTGTTTEVKPTVLIDGEPVGDGTVGPVTRQLHQAFLERVSRECGLAPV